MFWLNLRLIRYLQFSPLLFRLVGFLLQGRISKGWQGLGRQVVVILSLLRNNGNILRRILLPLSPSSTHLLPLVLGLNTGRCLNSQYFYHFLSTSALHILRISSYCNYKTMYKIHFTEESRVVEEFQF